MKNRNEVLLEKAEKILLNNIFKDGDYPWGNYRLISPSIDGKHTFNGVWNWDSAFHAIGMARIDIGIAKEQITGFLQFQKENGLLPDFINVEGKIEERFGKPPVMAYAAWRVYETCKDLEFLKEVYPKLQKNEEFWIKNRKYGPLFHYDSETTPEMTKEEYGVLVGYESGWDENPRWDNDPQNIWAIDLNGYMVMTYEALSLMAKELNLPNKEWEEKKARLIEDINTLLWDNERETYVDYNFIEKRPMRVLSPACFVPLFAGFAPKDKAEKMNEIALKHFMPCMPMVAFTDPDFDTEHYCRGACYLHIAYMAAKGLKDYGFTEIAETIKETILNWVYDDGDYIHENYHAITGKGKHHRYFSWSSVFVREFILNF